MRGLGEHEPKQEVNLKLITLFSHTAPINGATGVLSAGAIARDRVGLETRILRPYGPCDVKITDGDTAPP